MTGRHGAAIYSGGGTAWWTCRCGTSSGLYRTRGAACIGWALHVRELPADPTTED